MLHQSTRAFKSQSSRSSTPIFCNGRVVGQVEGHVFRKVVHSGRHFLRQPRAIAFDRSTLHDAEAAGARLVHVYDRNCQDTYTATLETVWQHCFPVRRGFGDQVGVPLDRWSINGAQPLAERRAAETNKERCDLQLGLFGGAA